MNVWIRQEAWMWRYSEYPARPVGAHYGINEYTDILFDVVFVQVIFDVASICSCSIVSSSLVRVPMHHVSCFMMQVSITNVSYPSTIKILLLPGNTILRRNAMIAATILVLLFVSWWRSKYRKIEVLWLRTGFGSLIFWRHTWTSLR